jgi:hypothetical protein
MNGRSTTPNARGERPPPTGMVERTKRSQNCPPALSGEAGRRFVSTDLLAFVFV